MTHRLLHLWRKFALEFGRIKGLRCATIDRLGSRSVVWKCADCGEVLSVECEL